ncbi:hypothetical protein DMENIID0001_012770 [Sergentomyia squamirostris]
MCGKDFCHYAAEIPITCDPEKLASQPNRKGTNNNSIVQCEDKLNIVRFWIADEVLGSLHEDHNPLRGSRSTATLTQGANPTGVRLPQTDLASETSPLQSPSIRPQSMRGRRGPPPKIEDPGLQESRPVTLRSHIPDPLSVWSAEFAALDRTITTYEELIKHLNSEISHLRTFKQEIQTSNSNKTCNHQTQIEKSLENLQIYHKYLI